MRIKGKNALVVGLARSGTGSANLLSALGAEVTVTDLKPREALREYIERLAPSVRLIPGGHPDEIFLNADLIVINPGVPTQIPQLVTARAKGVAVFGEVELAYRFLNEENDSSLTPPAVKGGFLAVTGANGKSTTTSLLDFMMRKGGARTILGGNIGNSLTEALLGAAKRGETGDCVVAELSSFQLESIEKFRPGISAILNITPDHMDRYHEIEKYAAAKARIFENQRGEDFLVLNRDDPETMKAYHATRGQRAEGPRVFFFSREQEVEGLFSRSGEVYCNIPSINSSLFSLIQQNEIRIKGVHNLENAMAASAMALLAGCPLEAVKDSLKEFAGLEHRLEFVRKFNGVSYFNDSKGTNVGAVIKSLESFAEPIVLIAGGRDKAGDFSLLRDLAKKRVKTLILIGEAAGKIGKALGDVVPAISAGDLKDAVDRARDNATEGDVVLLSPACASFDMFRDFEERGRRFKELVKALQE